ncbi:MAG: RtcB family protein [Clostridia bacterium]|nr:RtcB family protein [Clostridia bacterium]
MIMIEIIGEHNTAKCFTNQIEDSAREQIHMVCDTEAFSDSKIRIMPDVHAGKGCTIGTTMTVTDKIVPSMVGVDIGCGMYTVSLGQIDIDFKKFDEVAHYIPSGRDIWEGRQEKFDLQQLRCYRNLKYSKRLERSLGTLGGGNHFIEIDEDDERNKYLVIHSGSRNLGKQVAEHYQQMAVELNLGKEEYFRKRDEIICSYKAEGRRGEIQNALKQLDKEWKAKEPTLPSDLCYLYGNFMDDYLHDVDICQKFATVNREKIAEILLDKSGLNGSFAFHTVHNYIDIEEMILRKGAVSARLGEKLLIPINMRDGSLICVGKGNEDWNYSAPHGAGRLMSRSSAFERLTMAEYEEQMAGIYSTCVVPTTLDESPMAYKSLDDIVQNIQPTADIICHIRPIYNFKAVL